MKTMINDMNNNNATLSLPDRIYNYIIDNGLRPGDALPVRENLGEILGVGPRVLREALSVLEHQGVVATRSKAGTIVAEPSVEKLGGTLRWHLEAQGYELEDMIRARACLESAAAYEAAQQRSARDLLVILDALEQLEAKEKQNDTAEEKQFHLAILGATHNPVMTLFEHLILTHLEQTCSTADWNRNAHQDNEEHWAIYHAIEKQNAGQAMELMYQHIYRS